MRPLLTRFGTLLFGALGVALSAALVLFHFRGALLAKLRTPRLVEAAVPPPVRLPPPTPTPMYGLEDLRRLRTQFEAKDFAGLDKAASDLQTAFEADPTYEYEAFDFFRVFRSGRPGYEEILDEWVARSPTSFAARLARASYYYDKGYGKRGHDWAVNTSTEQFRGMFADFDRAAADISYALSINPRLLPAYTMRAAVYSAENDRRRMDAAFREGLSYFPTSFILRRFELLDSSPRWGGSYKLMNLEAQEAFVGFNKNHALYGLFGLIYADQAWQAGYDKRYDEAIRLYTKALAYGDNYDFHAGRAFTFIDMGDFARAAGDAEQAIALRPTMPDGYERRATAALDREDYPAAMQDVRLLAQELPLDNDARDWLAWASRTLLARGHAAFKTAPALTLERYGQALEADPTLAEAHYWRGVVYMQSKDLERASADMEEAIKDNPRYFEAYREWDRMASMQRRWDEIVDHWNSYLALVPDNADALLERAGAYHHKGDRTAEEADFRRSCELGNQQACAYHKHFE